LRFGVSQRTISGSPLNRRSFACQVAVHYARTVAYLLALLSAVCYGAADFLGGLASKRAATVAVVVVSQASGLMVLVVLMPLLRQSAPSGVTDLWWGLAAGLTGSIGVALLYRALAVGTMAIVAPTTAVCAVIIPVVAAVLGGERPATRTMLGIVIALAAIVLVSQTGPAPDSQLPTPNTERAAPGQDLGSWESGIGSSKGGGSVTARRVPRGLGLALFSGVAIGFFFLALAQTAADAGLWPLAVARVASLLLFVPFAVRGRRFKMSRPVFAIAVGGGILDMLANALYLIAVREGPLTTVVTLSSLYPASTVVLAGIVLHERISAVQALGIAGALLAVVLIVS
jgi:drug/metabolite transporter (DMT)-like permease